MIKKTTLKIATIIMAVSILFSSCATIFSKSYYDISIDSDPSEADFVIKDKKGNYYFEGQTPAIVKLKAGAGFFGKARYLVTFTKNGFESKTVPVEFTIDEWYISNILAGPFGVAFGCLIFDPLTGAMYKLDTEFLYETLTESTSSVQKNELKVYTLNEIPSQWIKHLVKVND